jgi:U8 snoRNA-decapping enzyme
MQKIQRIPFGRINNEKSNAVFLAIYVKEIAPWKYFQSDIQKVKCPAVIMIDRWDGRIGFPGGTMKKDEPILEALRREIKEEIGIRVRVEQVHPIASHEWKLCTHFYGLEVNELEFLHIYYHILNNFSRSILLHAYEEKDESRFMSETTGIKIVPIIEHKGKGINKFLESSFAGATKQDLEIFIEEILGVHLSE